VDCPDALIDAMLRQIDAQAGEFIYQAVCNTMWALVVLDMSNRVLPLLSLWHPQLTTIFENAENSNNFVQNVCQMHQVFISLRSDLNWTPSGDFVTFMQKACDTFRRESGNGNPSETQASVYRAVQYVVREQNYPVTVTEEEVLGDDAGYYSVDILLNREGCRGVIVEVDGPHHFLKIATVGGYTYSETESNGRTVIKRRLLSKLGWTLVQVPFFEWDHRSDSDRKGFVTELLEVALAGPG
jgi:hypothetical protein